ncbi:hypothetical protein HUT29_19275 [Pseudomonas chlororaphis]|uniref:hypothetical protein n=1 Tax=Pseudomonas chlororaphis TaxID=587753 RepID=UPI001B311C8F|nr:hypothetical protein [Pseudomonas chlororaphis]QTT83336.1 hypothetical protein HUT29_19275 [Pseudomonas chlororaphis]
MDKSQFSFFDGAIIDSTTIRLIGVEDARAENGIPHGLIMTRRGDQWLAVGIGEQLVSCTTTPVPDYTFIAIAESGREVDIGNNAVRQEVVALGEHSPTSNGPLTAVRAFANGQVFCVGTARQAYRKTGSSSWIRVDQTCKPDDPETCSTTAFLAVDGFCAEEVYAVGWEGEIWMFDGSGWHQIDSPTNLALHGLYCAPDGVVYICGKCGTLLKGRGSVWEVLEQSDTEEDLRSVCMFEGVLYVCSTNLVYRWHDEKKLEVVKMASPVSTTGRLTAAGHRMLSIGLKDVAIFDGQDWHQLV